MSLTLDLDLEPDEQARLETLAKERGLPVNAYAYAVLKREIATASPPELEEQSAPRKRSLLELRGLGAEIWKDIGDAQEWVNAQRAEWDDRP
jgi:hypothetical protein